jgi:hypothetical protein
MLCCAGRSDTPAVPKHKAAVVQEFRARSLRAGRAEAHAGHTPIVLDCGSGVCKVGFANSKRPLASFRTVIGRPSQSHHKVMDTSTHQDEYVARRPL